MAFRVAGLLLAAQALLWLPGCGPHAGALRPARVSGAWSLVTPPEVADASFPRGVRLVPVAPMAEWQLAAAFDSEEACEASRQGRANDAIDQARATQGDDAKFDLPVRRAVNARCVRGDVLPPSR